MALYYPMVERVHVANHLRVLNQRDPETLTWALSRENKLDIGESACARGSGGEMGERGKRVSRAGGWGDFNDADDDVVVPDSFRHERTRTSFPRDRFQFPFTRHYHVFQPGH